MNTYYLTIKYKILSAVLPVAVMLFFFQTTQSDLFCFGVISIGIIFFSIKNIISEHITLSQDGIEYHRLGLTFNTKWENVRELETQWFPPFEHEGISLDPDQIRITEWWSGNYTGYGGWSRKSFIPLSKFSENWRDSELGQQIKQHAPHLFEKEKSA